MFIITDTNPNSDEVQVAFLLDGSMGVSSYQYHTHRVIAECIMWDLNQYSTQFDAAVVVYSDEATLVVNFTQRFDFELFVNRLRNWPDKSDRRQRIDKALTFTSKDVFPSTGKDIVKIAILFAFTEQLQPGFYGNASESLRQKGVRIFVVEVNSINPREELLSITEREDDLIHMSSITFGVVDILVSKVLKAIGKF